LFEKVNNPSSPASLDDLATFAAVAEAESFSAAARRLQRSKAMVSVAVARLEQQLGARLFQRTTRRLSLTESGKATLPHAQRAVTAAQEALDAATQTTARPRGELRVNAPMSFGLAHVVPALGALSRLAPEVVVDLVLDDRVLDLIEGGFDLALRIAELPDSSLVAQRLSRSRSVLVAHPDYLSRHCAPRRPADLALHSALLYSLSPTSARWTLHRGKRSETVRVKPALKANSSLALQQALAQGLGVARMPLFLVGEELRQGRLVQLLPDWNVPELGIFAVTTSRAYQPAKTRAFIEFFKSRLGEPPYWE
jgi:DNA-binding transcriptional LysR family regulator